MASIAQTRSGKVEGEERDGIHVFRGVPFAAPPVGAKRWRAPEREVSWSGVRPAKAFGNVSPQNPLALDLLPAFKIAEPQSEDCLYLNVWTPGVDGARRPVMVWIHGGAFTIGSGSQSLYESTRLAKRGDVVVVTINYRLGALGFLRLQELTNGRIPSTGNEGMLDQVAALEWVRENIAAFGGDPDNVTIFGESAGGMSVGTLLGMPKARGLFHKAIPQSGACSTANSRERHIFAAQRFAELVGARRRRRAAARKTAAELLAAAARTAPIPGQEADERLGGMPFQPVVDGEIVPRLSIESVARGSAAGVALLVGSTRDEWKLFAAADPAVISAAGAAARGARREAARRRRPAADRALSQGARGTRRGRRRRRSSSWRSRPTASSACPASAPRRDAGAARPARLQLPVHLGVADVRRHARLLPRARARLRLRHPQGRRHDRLLGHRPGRGRALREHDGRLDRLRAHGRSELEGRRALAELHRGGARHGRAGRALQRSSARRSRTSAAPGAPCPRTCTARSERWERRRASSTRSSAAARASR